MMPMDFCVIGENMKLQAHQSLFFTRIIYGEIEPVFPSEARPLNREDIGKEDEVLLISGIAAPLPFISEAKKYSDKVLPVIFRTIIRLASRILKNWIRHSKK